MAEKIRELMTANPVMLDASSVVIEAARKMRDKGIGDVLVQKSGSLCGIVTDRDLVVRCLAEGANPEKQTLGDICTSEVSTLDVNASAEEAIEMMKERAVRRIPVMEAGEAIGIISLGDLAEERDPDSVLGRISTAPAQA